MNIFWKLLEDYNNLQKITKNTLTSAYTFRNSAFPSKSSLVNFVIHLFPPKVPWLPSLPLLINTNLWLSPLVKLPLFNSLLIKTLIKLCV
jgi:hypothetical protein